MSEKMIANAGGAADGGEASPAIEAVTSAFYAAFDNRAGRSPDESRLRALILPTATIVRRDGGYVDVMTLDAFIAPRLRMLEDGTLADFHEWEVSGATLQAGGLAVRHSLYRKQGVLRGEPYEGWGRKLIQLVFTEDDWRIASVLWEDLLQDERPG